MGGLPLLARDSSIERLLALEGCGSVTIGVERDTVVSVAKEDRSGLVPIGLVPSMAPRMGCSVIIREHLA